MHRFLESVGLGIYEIINEYVDFEPFSSMSIILKNLYIINVHVFYNGLSPNDEPSFNTLAAVVLN